MIKGRHELTLVVIRRVGGLEEIAPGREFQEHVIRRVGGLEGSGHDGGAVRDVIRRVGGLEGQMGLARHVP